MTARYWTAQFEWQAHARLARQASLGQEVIDAIAERRTPIFSDPDEQLVYDFCNTFYRLLHRSAAYSTTIGEN